MRSHLLEQLDYLHSCRDRMGEARYGDQRRRMELHAQMLAASKYSTEPVAPAERCAYSAQVRRGA